MMNCLPVFTTLSGKLSSMPTMPVDKLKLYYERGGAGVPVIFIHGGFASLQMALSEMKPYNWSWENDFAQHFDFIWYERRGCYRSPRPQDGYDLVKQAHDLLQLLDHLEVDVVHIIGSSAGGPIGIFFAAVYPERVHSLTLVGTALDLFPLGDKPSDIIRKQLQILEQHDSETAYEQRPNMVETTVSVLWAKAEAKERGTLDAFTKRQKMMVERAKNVSYSARIAWYVAELRNIQAYIDFALHVYVQKVNVPTMIVHGEYDRSVPLNWAKELATEIPTSSFLVVPKGNHSLIFRDEGTRHAIIEFIHNIKKQ
jgi:pimeloyl-ACP methyl ester carboxylesterase